MTKFFPGNSFSHSSPLLLLLLLLNFHLGQGQTHSLKDSLHADQLLDSIRNYERDRPLIGLEWADSLYRFSETADYPLGKLRALNRTGRIQDVLGNFAASEKAYLSGLEIAHRMKRFTAIAMLSDQLGSLNRKLGRYPQSLVLHQRALFLYDSLEIQAGIPICYNNLAIIYKIMGDDSTAGIQYRQAVTFSRRLEKWQGVAAALLNLSQLHLKYQRFDSALVCQSEALELAKTYGLPVREAQAHSALFDTYMGLGEYDRAYASLEKAIPMMESFGDRFRLAGLKVKMGRYQYKTRALKQAQRTLASALELGQEIGASEVVKSASFLQHRVAQEQGNYKAALAYYKNFVAINDSLVGLQTQREIAELKTRFELDKNQAELAQQEAELARMDAVLRAETIERRTKELELERTQNRVWLLVSIVAFLLLAVVFFITWYFFNEKRNRLLLEKQELTEQALQDKEVLMSELHHRVKNNLQLIYNLLDLQSRQLDGAAKLALEESMGRLTSMALIHQELYQEKNVSGIYLPGYLQDLCDQIFRSFGRDAISLHLDVAPISLDISSVVPLGLTINELVTNSLKHAFPDAESGRILVALKKEADYLQLEVSDDGVGVGEVSGTRKGFGKTLIRSLSRQMKAELEEEQNDGYRTVLKIHKFRLVGK